MWFRIAACVVSAGLSLSSVSPAQAQRQPGVQSQPPMAPASLELPQASDGRRAVRGCPVGQDCVPLHRQLHLIELEMFPQKGSDPWSGGDDGAASIEATAAGVYARKPSELRADLAWLDDVELPDLPVRWTPKLVEYLQFYKSDPRGRNIMRGWLVAAGRYRELITHRLQSAGLPLDLFYVAMIESSFEPRESSSAGAAGLWQFMPSGGRIYGLMQNHWVDERRDPLRATAAAIDYWRDLYQRFGDWHLAMAAYNAGYGAILRSIARYNTNDYWQLCLYENALAWEASLYVPKALAVAIVGHNLETFGFQDVKPESPEPTEEVTVPVSMALSVVAKAAGTTSERIKKLNPQLRRNRTPPDAKNYVLRVPRGGKPDFSRRLAELQSEWDGYDAYVVAYGERFEDVAATFGLSKRKLRELNELTDDSETGGGSVLVVPRVAAEQRGKNRAAARAALHESGVDQQAGEAMIVALPDKDAVVAGKRRGFYRVVIGDTLVGVAKAFAVAPAELARWNGLDVQANLHPRMVLAAWLPKNFEAEQKKRAKKGLAEVALLDESRLTVVTRGSPEHLDLIEQRVGRERVRYVAQKQESFETIAKKFGLKAADLARVNHLSPKTVLKAGDEIVVYKVIDKSRSDRAAEQWQKMPKARRKTVAEKARGVTGRIGRDAEAVEVGAVSEDDEDSDDAGGGGDGESQGQGAEERQERQSGEAKDEPVSRPQDKAGKGEKAKAEKDGARSEKAEKAEKPEKSENQAKASAGKKAEKADAAKADKPKADKPKADKADAKTEKAQPASKSERKADKSEGKADKSERKSDKDSKADAATRTAESKKAEPASKADEPARKPSKADLDAMPPEESGGSEEAAPVTSPAQMR